MSETKKGQDPSKLDDMIAHAYSAILDQDRFDELIFLAEGSISDPRAHRELLRRKRDIESHFETAEKLLSSLKKPAIEPDRPEVTIGSDLSVKSVNDIAQNLLGLSPGVSLEDLPIDGDALTMLRDAIAGRLSDWPVIRIPNTDTGKQVLLALSRGEAELNGGTWTLSGVDRVWRSGASLAMQSLYGLTPSETDVLSLLVSGHSPSEVADTRKRSVDTVRQQIKSMITKTRSRGTSELIDLARAVAASANKRSSDRQSTENYSRLQLRLRDGRQLDYLEQGAPDGKPVVFLHGCLCGNRMPNTAARHFAAEGIRLLSPARPWHGRSDGHDILLLDPKRYAHDLNDMLDQLDIEKVSLVAFDVGSIFALLCLPELQERVSEVLCVSAQPPMRTLQDFASAPPQQKLFAILPRVSVSLLSYMAKLGDKRLKRDGPGGFAQTVFGGAPADLDACRDPHLLDLFWQGHLFHVEEGSESFINDCRFVASDWERQLAPTEVPIHFVHGTQNRSIRPERILAFADRLNARVTLVENAGHSLPFSHWKDWVRFLSLK
ncbi:alpha/beta fold hydrolase [uncultured Roseibium sp.]|uniref:alpha/beta fold hydrolase n=1 Tax=uncultured Roseibium sp. TaxID=1936171 RepID=UPI00262CCBA5|nr:alpha/beta fold hydrolase [uncultured Roseibium sp.]